MRKLIFLALIIYLLYLLSRKKTPTETRARNSTAPANHYYEILQISPQASSEDIKEAYRRLSRMYHPDTVANQPADVQKKAADMMAMINGAYSELKKQRGFP